MRAAVRDRVRAALAAPAGMSRAAPAVARPASVAVLGPMPHARAAGAALALRLARRDGASCALLAGGGMVAGPRLPATRAAARAAAALLAREIHAVASGRLVRAEADAASFAHAAAAVPGPAVLAVAEPRRDPTDSLLAAQDALVLVPPPSADPELARLAEASLIALGRRVAVCQGAGGPLARAAAIAGLGVAPSLGDALTPALEAIR